MPGTPLIAPALARQAVRSIKAAGAGVTALIECEFALGVAVLTLGTQTGLSRTDIGKVLSELARLPEHCIEEDDEFEIEEVEEVEIPKKSTKRKRRRTKKRSKKKGKRAKGRGK